MAELAYILIRLLHLNTRIPRDDSQAGARSVQEASVEFLENIGHFPAIIICDNAICDAETVQVGV